MALQDQLDALRAEQLEQTPEAIQEIERDAMRLIVESGSTAAHKQIGDVAPDFELFGVQGDRISLAALRRRGPVILDFFRGGWCPFCSLELRAYQQLIQDIENAGASLVAISPETPVVLREAVRENRLTFPVLSDHDNLVAKRFGIVYTLPEALRAVYEGFGLDLPARQQSNSFELPVPATFLVDSTGKIRRAYFDVDTSKRGDPEDFLRAIREARASS